MKVLLVEDDSSLGGILSERLRESGYDVSLCTTIASAEKESVSFSPDVAILDVNLPDGSGFDFARSLKTKTDLPVLFLTAMNSAENRLMGYELGAEEYIPKPFHFRELLIRLKHVLENHAISQEVVCPVGKILLKQRAIISSDGTAMKIAAKDFEILRLLIESAPSALSRDEILNKVWGAEVFPSPRTIDNSILRIRQIICDENSCYIRSVRGVGYQWIGGESE